MSDPLQVSRVKDIAGGFSKFTNSMGATESLTIEDAKVLSELDPATRDALSIVFSGEGNYLQDLVVEVSPQWWPKYGVTAAQGAAFFQALQDADGARIFRLPYREDLIGNARLPALHGGAIAGFVESAALFEVLISQAQQRVPRVVDMTVDYLRSGRARDTFAVGRVVRQGSRIAQVQVDVWQDQRERLIAFARADFLLQED